MQISNVNIKDLNPEFRIDAEYYRAEVLNRLGILQRHKKANLDDLVDFVIGPFGSTVTADKYVSDSDYRYIRNKDIDDFLIKDDAPALISKEVYENLPHFHIKEDDLLITVVGTLGKVAIATKKDAKSIFSCKSTILRAKRINPFFLLAYLNCKTGQLFCLRGKRGAIQEGLNLSDLKEIQVYIPKDDEFQTTIENIIRISFGKTENSNHLYSQADELLLSELGLLDWRPKHILSFVRNYSETGQAGRIDAEYFQPKYEQIVKAIKSYKGGWDTLGNLVNIKDRNYTPKDKQSYKYIELANIAGNGEITDCMIEEGQNLPSRARRKVGAGDVIVSSIEGSLSSIALIEKEYDQSLCSTGFYVVNSKILNSPTLLVLLKSMIGQLQLKKGCSGTILTAINSEELKKVILPVIDQDTQARIRQKIDESFALRRQSKHLLACAKQAVEMAIEKDETTALQWLKERAKDNG